MIGWFLAPYRQDPVRTRFRYCAMNDFNVQIVADGGRWSECEMLGDYAVVKVNAAAGTLTTIAGTAGFQRIPPRFLDLSQTLGDLTTGERTTILNFLLARGYTSGEISAALGSTLTAWRTRTLAQVLRFALTRRLKPRYDSGADAIVLDGPVQPTRPLEEADADVI